MANKLYNFTWKVSRGVVVAIKDILDAEGEVTNKKRIMVCDYNSIDDYDAKEALPPSLMPTTAVGTGTLSWPKVGQELIYASHPNATKLQILSYMTQGQHTPFGGLAAEKVNEGDIIQKIGGRIKSVFTLGNNGLMKLFSNAFAFIKVDGSGKKISLGCKEHSFDFAGGLVRDIYLEKDSVTNKNERTDHYEVYMDRMTNPGFWDWRSETNESTPLIPDPINGYTSKAIIKAGSAVSNPKKGADGILNTHPYEIATRQATAISQFKDSTTQLKFGYQFANFPSSGSEFKPAGDLIEWRAKRNVAGQEIGTFLFRYGKFSGDYGTKTVGIAATPGTTPKEAVQGELHRLQIFDGIADGLLLGTPVTDPMGDGQGYGFHYPERTDAQQQYTFSVGKLESPLLAANPDFLGASYIREHYHSRDIVQTGDFWTRQIGGATPTDTRYKYEMFESKQAAVVQDSLEEVFSKTTVPAALSTYKREHIHLGSQSTTTFDWVSGPAASAPPGSAYVNLSRTSTANQSDIHLKFSEEATQSIATLSSAYTGRAVSLVLDSDSTLPIAGNIELNNSADKLVLKDGTINLHANNTTKIDLASATDTLTTTATTTNINSSTTHNTSAPTINIDGDTITLSAGSNTITLDSTGITLSAAGQEVKLATAGTTVNGKGVVNSTFGQFMMTHMATFGMGNMGAPVPLNPAGAAVDCAAQALVLDSAGGWLTAM